MENLKKWVSQRGFVSTKVFAPTDHVCRLHTLSSGAGNRRESVEYDYFLLLFYCKTRTTVQTVQTVQNPVRWPVLLHSKGFFTRSGAVESHKGRKKGGTRMYGKLLAAADGCGLWLWLFLVMCAQIKTVVDKFGYID